MGMSASTIALEPGPRLREPPPLPGALAGPGPNAGAALLHEKFTAFSRTFAVIVACELWSEVARVEGMLRGTRFAVAVLFTAAAAAIAMGRWARPAAAFASALLAVRLACFLPLSANHYYLEVIYAFFLAIPAADPREEDLVLKAVRSTVIVGLIASGIQKAAHGCYFGGEFLCFMLAHDPRFDVLSPLVPAPEVLRLHALEKGIGAGPYRVDSVPLLIVSNLTYVLEVLLPIGLLVPRLRRVALAAAVAFVVAIEVAARELFFGALMINSLLVFSRGGLHRKAMPLLAAFCIYLLAVSLGLLPRWRFS
jgi:hypothetical protein